MVFVLSLHYDEKDTVVFVRHVGFSFGLQKCE